MWGWLSAVQLCGTNKADCCSVTRGGTAACLSGGCVLVLVYPLPPCFFGMSWKNTSTLLGHKKSCGLTDRIWVFSHNIQQSKHYIYFDKADRCQLFTISVLLFGGSSSTQTIMFEWVWRRAFVFIVPEGCDRKADAIISTKVSSYPFQVRSGPSGVLINWSRSLARTWQLYKSNCFLNVNPVALPSPPLPHPSRILPFSFWTLRQLLFMVWLPFRGQQDFGRCKRLSCAACGWTPRNSWCFPMMQS